MASDWKVVIDDTGGPLTGWPSVCSESADRCVFDKSGFDMDHPNIDQAIEIAEVVAAYMNDQYPTVPRFNLEKMLLDMKPWCRDPLTIPPRKRKRGRPRLEDVKNTLAATKPND